jgi:hypothetical protein
MMRKKVVFTRNPARASFFSPGYSQNPIFKKTFQAKYKACIALPEVIAQSFVSVMYY